MALGAVTAMSTLSAWLAPEPAAVPAPVRLPYDARGRVAAVQQARVATLRGGVVRALPRGPGEAVAARQEIARIEAPDGSAEVVVAPFAGTLLAVPARVGDSLLPGAAIAVVGDLTALRIETTDLDEYVLPRVRVGQLVEITVDALPDRRIFGRVTAVSRIDQPGSGGRRQYPVYVALPGGENELQPGMGVQLRFVVSGSNP